MGFILNVLDIFDGRASFWKGRRADACQVRIVQTSTASISKVTRLLLDSFSLMKILMDVGYWVGKKNAAAYNMSMIN